MTADGLRDVLVAQRRLQEAGEAHGAGRWRQAVAGYREVLRMRPGHRVAANNLAWILATCPDERVRSGEEAVVLMQWAKEEKGTVMWQHVGTLAGAYAEAGDFAEAMRWGERAKEIAAGADEGRWERWLKLFREGRAIRER